MPKKIEELREFLSVCESPNPLTPQDIEAAFDLLQAAKNEARQYMLELMNGKPSHCRVTMPVGDLEVFSIDKKEVEELDDIELIHLPFGVFSLNLWQELLKDKNNPLFQILDYFEFNTRGIRNILAMHGVEPSVIIDCDLLNEHDIMDIYSLHSYENVYRDVFDITHP